MTPLGRFAASLVLALLLCLPPLRAALAGEADVAAIASRYLLGFLLVWAVLGLLARLVDSYAAANEAAEAEVGAPDTPGAPPVPQRRRTDPGYATLDRE